MSDILVVLNGLVAFGMVFVDLINFWCHLPLPNELSL